MARVQLKIDADASAAKKEIDGLAGSLQGVGESAMAAELNTSKLAGQAGQLASNLGLGGTQARVMTQGVQMLTGGLRGMNLAFGAAGLALTAIVAGVQAYRAWQERLTESTHRAAVAQREFSRSMEDHTLRSFRLLQEASNEEMRVLQRRGEMQRLATQLGIRNVRDEMEVRGRAIDLSHQERHALQQVSRLEQQIQSARGPARAALERQLDVERELLQVNRQQQQQLQALIGLRDQDNAQMQRAIELARQYQRVLMGLPPVAGAAAEANDRLSTSVGRLAVELDKIGQFAKDQALEQLAEQQRRLNAEIEHANALKREQMAMFAELADKEMEQLVEARTMRQELLEQQAAGELAISAKQKEEEVKVARDAEDKIAALYAQRTAMAMNAAGMIAQGLQRAADGGIKAALSQIGASLQAEGIQRSLQGVALGLFGDPRGGAIAATGAAMTAAGTAMRGAAGGGGRGIPGGTAAPSAGGAAAQRGDVNINVNEGLVSDPQRTAQAVAGAVRDAHTRGLL